MTSVNTDCQAINGAWYCSHCDADAMPTVAFTMPAYNASELPADANGKRVPPTPHDFELRPTEYACFGTSCGMGTDGCIILIGTAPDVVQSTAPVVILGDSFLRAYYSTWHVRDRALTFAPSADAPADDPSSAQVDWRLVFGIVAAVALVVLVAVLLAPTLKAYLAGRASHTAPDEAGDGVGDPATNYRELEEGTGEQSTAP